MADERPCTMSIPRFGQQSAHEVLRPVFLLGI
jgi:hypothetical protein